ncbi:unnamed protein product [Ranitomeya imitator]|uniref:Tc1-like transposase DDE domain-containing protein n=1 Tax=Ranitomeya imitator TaxID=111125 RepID=A0ABN9L4W5_9NEOB|nr:unnamed protein product [Ranitomeya imitator]
MSHFVLRDENQENVQPRKQLSGQHAPPGGRTVLGVLQENRGLRAQRGGKPQAPILAANNTLGINDENYGRIPAGKTTGKQTTFTIHVDEPDCTNYKKQTLAKKPMHDENLKQLNSVVISLGHRQPLAPIEMPTTVSFEELVGPFRVEDGVKLNSQTYCQFLEDFFKQWYRKKSVSFKKNMIFMQDNAPSHASNYSTAWLASKGLKEEKIMTWPPCSPDLNPIENLWSLIKCEIYREGKQSTSRKSVWEAVVPAARNVDRKQIMQLTIYG